jgi:hypothetical protein
MAIWVMTRHVLDACSTSADVALGEPPLGLQRRFAVSHSMFTFPLSDASACREPFTVLVGLEVSILHLTVISQV